MNAIDDGEHAYALGNNLANAHVWAHNCTLGAVKRRRHAVELRRSFDNRHERVERDAGLERVAHRGHVESRERQRWLGELRRIGDGTAHGALDGVDGERMRGAHCGANRVGRAAQAKELVRGPEALDDVVDDPEARNRNGAIDWIEHGVQIVGRHVGGCARVGDGEHSIEHEPEIRLDLLADELRLIATNLIDNDNDEAKPGAERT